MAPKKINSPTEAPAAVLDVDDDQELLQREAKKRGLKTFELEMKLNALHGESPRARLARLEAQEQKQVDAETEARERRIAGNREVAAAQEKIIVDGVQEFGKLALYLVRLDAANPTGIKTGYLRRAIATGLLERLRAFARESSGTGALPDLSGIEI